MAEAPAGVGPVDLLDPHLYAGDPGPTYRWLRDEHPAYRDANGMWAVSRHADVLAVERAARRYSNASGSRPLIDMRESMINKDDPEHAAQRRMVSARFTPAAVRTHEDRVREVVTGLIDAVAGAGRAEVVDDLAAPLPAMVIAELVGFGRGAWRRVREWSEATMTSAGFKPDEDPSPGANWDAIMDFAGAVGALIDERRAAPADDLVSRWVAGGMPDAEIIQEALLVVDGGAETTKATIAQTVVTLCREEGERRQLAEDPALLRSTAVEEMIRWSTPILNMRRTVAEAHDLHGQRLEVGDTVLVMYGAANRDERAFAEPDRFRVRRPANRHVAFGFGTHFCLGANLARLELRVLFEQLLARLPDLRLAPGFEPEHAPGYFTRCLREVPVEWVPVR